MNPLKIKRFLFRHGIVLLVLLFIVVIYRCPIYYFFHIPCPGCGITRAYMAAFRLDFKSAFNYHPLFWAIIPPLLYIPHRNIMKKHLSYKAETTFSIGFSLLFIIVYIIRRVV